MERSTLKKRNNIVAVVDEYDEDQEDELYSKENNSPLDSDELFHDEDKEAKALRDKIIKGEERAVRNARVGVMIATVACAAAVGVSIYLFALGSDQKNFEIEYDGFVADIISLVQWEVQYNFALMQQFSASMTSAAIMTGATFPNMTHPQFEIVGGYVDGMGGIMSVVFAPLIKGAQRTAWEEYSVINQGWLQESIRLKKFDSFHRDALHGTIQDHEHDRRRSLQQQDASLPPNISTSIFHWEDGKPTPYGLIDDSWLLAPLWQGSPADASAVNVDMLSDDRVRSMFDVMVQTDLPLLSPHTAIGDLFDWLFDPHEKPEKVKPHGFLMSPVYSAFDEERDLVGFILGVTPYSNLFDRLLPEGTSGVRCVVKDSCGGVLTFALSDGKADYLGPEDLHDPKYDRYMHSFDMEVAYSSLSEIPEGVCAHTVYIYPSSSLQESYDTNKPTIYASVVAVAFFTMAFLFFLYDRMVARRQDKTMETALRTNRVVSSLFPETVRDRILATSDEDADAKKLNPTNKKVSFHNNTKTQVTGNKATTPPIADFYPHTTVMFADICGFTAWASTREPFQVFTLLETIYGELDEIARRRKVFKVETVGDCYVAVCGIPTQNKDHAIIMCRFARDCHETLRRVTRNLEITLGPDTADLAFRVGLHSGPITGGVLRGDNARFQLFGDTMNTAARMESTGARGRVQVSDRTANLLVQYGKGHWVKPRGETVAVKGKGDLETFWLNVETSDSASSASTLSLNSSSADGTRSEVKIADLNDSVPARGGTTHQPNHRAPLSDKNLRLVEWTTTVLLKCLEIVVSQRGGGVCVVGSNVEEQLNKYIYGIASMYRDNSFHNFEHASHVTMSVTKMLSRVINNLDSSNGKKGPDDYTKDLVSDGMTQFAVVFSALIHDVDHPGVSNAQLVAEGAPVAKKYNNRSVAENNSIEVAWELFLSSEFDDFRSCLCPTQSVLGRFRALVVSCVLATDVFDKDLIQERNEKWAKVFSETAAPQSQRIQEINHFKASIVLEHLVQASDVAHTMQHWHVYRKWNERLFCEMLNAYSDSRASKTPVDSWYEGELGFFDFYVIPLARKLKECGVFGVSSDEFLAYAESNRREWERRGADVVAGLVELYLSEEDKKYDGDTNEREGEMAELQAQKM